MVLVKKKLNIYSYNGPISNLFHLCCQWIIIIHFIWSILKTEMKYNSIIYFSLNWLPVYAKVNKFCNKTPPYSYTLHLTLIPILIHLHLHLHLTPIPTLTPYTYTLLLTFTSYTLHLHLTLTPYTYTLLLTLTPYTYTYIYTYTLHLHLTPNTYTLHLHLCLYLHLHLTPTPYTYTYAYTYTYTLHIHPTPNTYTFSADPARLLLTFNAQIDLKQPSSGCTALHWACQSDNQFFVTMCIEKGADLLSPNNKVVLELFTVYLGPFMPTVRILNLLKFYILYL